MSFFKLDSVSGGQGYGDSATDIVHEQELAYLPRRILSGIRSFVLLRRYSTHSSSRLKRPNYHTSRPSSARLNTSSPPTRSRTLSAQQVDFAKVEPRESSKPLVVSPSRRDPNDPADAEGLRSAHRDPKHSRRPRKTQDRGTREAHTNGSGASPSNLSDSAHERVAAAHNAGGVSTSGSGGSNNNSRSNSRSNSSSSNINGVASREPRPHAGSFGGLAQQLTTLGRGGGGGFGKGTPPLGNRPRPSSTAVSVERTPPADPSKQLEEMPQQRWGMGRLRQKQEWRSVGGSVAGGSGSRDGRKSIQETRATWPEGWKDGFRRSSGLSGLRPRTVTVPGSSGRSWGRSSVLLGCDTGGDGAVGAMNDADGAEATFLGPSGNLRPAFASDEEGDGAFMTIDPRYNVEASFWQP